jgi:hypothetical protein
MNLRRKAWQLPLRLAAGSYKDVWLAAIGASLVIDDLVGRGSRS